MASIQTSTPVTPHSVLIAGDDDNDNAEEGKGGGGEDTYCVPKNSAAQELRKM